MYVDDSKFSMTQNLMCTKGPRTVSATLLCLSAVGCLLNKL